MNSYKCEATHFHVIPFTEDLFRGPASVAAGLGHIVTDHIRGTVVEDFQFQANSEGHVILQKKSTLLCIFTGERGLIQVIKI